MVIKREELEAALAQAEAAREELEAKLADAKAVLVTTVTDASKIDANRAEVEAKVKKARARCRQLQAALLDISRLGFIAQSRERLGALVEQSDDLSTSELITRPASVQPRRQATPRKDEGSVVKPSRLKRFGDALAASPQVREAIGLLALTLAYLQYYYLDVQLQIMSLPSVIVLPPH
jgi:hypothetical protein